MAFIVNIGRTLRTHWKKSIFFTGLSIYGVKYAYERHEENLLRRVYCAEAKKYGDEKIPMSQRPRRVTVFLNPAAQAGKARKLFEKNAAPILYLAGIEVNVVKTEYEGQIKKFLGVLEPGETDTVTGILRKDDKKFHKIPVGVIPLGYTNSFSHLLYGVDKDAVRMIADAAMAVVKAVTKKVDVLKIDGGEGRTTFALCGMEMGAYRDAEDRKSSYWYFGPLKSRWTYLRTAMKEWPPVLKAELSYVEATEENMTVPVKDVAPRKKVWSFFGFLFRKNQPDQEEVEVPVKETQEEEESVSRSLSTMELTLMTPNMLPNQDFPSIQVGIGPAELSRSDFITEGWRRINQTGPKYGSETDETLLVKNIDIRVQGNQEDGPLWYNIDGEAFEAIPVTVSLLREKLNFFYPVFDPSRAPAQKTDDRPTLKH
ncbi:hypothetical protein BaRGS_00034232 [Batillaria attramentaria]|uniref:Acylglycerol kinase, mitochondrial n=1 Tax=Batillaria attramentaria TaxID=370345 RepID=A0ABD0JID0_9CAEN